jgi:CubicO group peptidase (beta-lactamase class C family)
MLFTATAILKLQEEGKLTIDDPLTKYFPANKNWSGITLRQMLAQRSGIPPIDGNRRINYDSMTKFNQTASSLIRIFEKDSLLFSPGSKYNHGRSEYILLARIIEMVSGKSFGSYLHQSIFEPLAMKNSGHYENDKETISLLAKGYAPKGLFDVEPAFQLNPSSKTGHASIYSTVYDLYLFAQAVIENKLLSKKSWEIMYTDNGGQEGFGWFLQPYLNRNRLQMNGRFPGYSSDFAIYPKEKMVVVVLSNNYISVPSAMGMMIAAEVLSEKYEPLKLSKAKLNESYAKKLVGTYKFDEKFYQPNFALSVRVENGYLFTPWGGFIPIDKGDKNFKEYILRPYWSSIRFVENSNGEITEMIFDGHKGIRIK